VGFDLGRVQRRDSANPAFRDVDEDALPRGEVPTNTPPRFSALRRKTFTALVKRLTAAKLVAGGKEEDAGICSVPVTVAPSGLIAIRV
jgi:hypothetical protein